MREKILFDENWYFHDGDIDIGIPREKAPIYSQAKTERFLRGPASRWYSARPEDYSLGHELNYDKWENVQLPHDYIIRQEPREEYNSALGYFDYHPAWYRKIFTLTEEDKNRRLTLLFDGVAAHCTVYLNGCPLKHNFCGYTGFEVDITDFAEFGKPNVLAVYVDPTPIEGWWYAGGGIYRHVWLIKTDRVAMDLWGLYVIPRRQNDGSWALTVENTLRNDDFADETVRVVSEISYCGQTVLTREGELTVPARDKAILRLEGRVDSPWLWSVDDPNLYMAVTRIYRNEEEIDRCESRFGFRWYDYSPETGLSLNGKPIFINGVCGHGDFGLTGKAVPDNILRHKVELMKEMGANGYRCSHYPQADVTMDALDELGFVVMAECRWFDSSDEGIEQLRALIRRDRNHPSILFWSVGNEEPHFTTECGRRICRSMIAEVRRLDDTRLIMAAVDKSPDRATVYDELDAIGVNYNLDKYDAIHEKYPDKLIFASECCATGTTRSWYFDDIPAKGYICAYDHDVNNTFRGREGTWKFLHERKWVAGGYQWIAFEHRGECAWPRLCSQSGAIDLFLQKKDAFYQNLSLFSRVPMIHLLPHWNWQGMEGQPIRVVAYTNCPAAELFLNGISLGRVEIEPWGHGEWSVPYRPGELKVIGYHTDGTVEDCRITAGRAHSLELIAENSARANGQDILLFTCRCLDGAGREVPDASPFVRFGCNRLGSIVGTGSDVTDHVPVICTDRKMYAGRISIAVRVGKEPGELQLYAEADGLNRAICRYVLNK